MNLSETDDADLTGRAKVRNAALRQFATGGFAGTSLRSVAAAAGVSVGLVQHHFGTKAKLIEACDSYTVEFIRRETQAGIVERRLEDPEFLSAEYRGAPPVMAYLSRALVDDSPGAAAMFDEMVAIAVEHLGPGDQRATGDDAVPARTLAAVLTAMKLGLTILHQHLVRSLELDDTEAGRQRISAALLALIGPGLTGSGAEIAQLAEKGLHGLKHNQ
ncbi:TetR family transcriptional regulator [Kribbella sp. NPDC056861]|uniref:TetR/AcrR family transcriptional regulator n=1 Tax=Kribbella sp. NPDC056861 TaxID=3154857 RepID=UPI00341FD713